MYYYIPHAVIVVSSLGILYILNKKLEVILTLPKKPEQIIPAQTILKNWLLKLKDLALSFRYRSWGPVVLSWIEKRLRGLRILFLKTDNFIGTVIDKSKDRGQAWKVRSKAWSEQKRTEKLDKLKVLEKLDRVEFLEMIEEGNEEGESEKNGQVKIKTEKSEQEKEEKKNLLAQEKEYINRIAKNPKDKTAYLQLGKLYLAQENFKDAESSFTEVLKIDPDNEEAKEELEKLEGKN